MMNEHHHRPSDPAYDNPFADRFDKVGKPDNDRYSRTAYVLQGGGSLGAYQTGVIRGLLEAGYEPDWISATSIGAIIGSIVVGNAPEDRMNKLDEFWHRVSTHGPFDMFGYSPSTFDLYNTICSNSALIFGQQGFFLPRVPSPYFSIPQSESTPANLSVYDTYPLRQTLLDLVDFERLNSSLTRLSLGAVQVNTGQLIYFNNINYLLGPEHVMASAALPPGFPAIKIDGEYYWDGGIHSNTPLEVIIDAKPSASTLCFVIDCFGGTPFIPNDMDGVAERSKDISYSTHARRLIKFHIERQHLKIRLHELSKELNAEQREKLISLIDSDEPHQHTLVHINYSARIHRASSKDYNFGHVTISKRIDAGYRDSKAMIAESGKWEKPADDLQCRVYEAPNNMTRLMRVGE